MLRATTWTHGRGGALIGASAAVVCLGGLLAACAGGGDGDGYVAVGVPGGAGRTAAPTGGVTLVPLQSPDAEAARSSAPSANLPSGSSTSAEAQRGPSSTPSPATPVEGADPSRTAASSPTPPPARPPGSVTPAALTWSEPRREATEKRWCEKVTLGFHNSGGSPVRSGAVTFGTHIIGALGIDWGTVQSVAELPVPVAAGARKEKTWTVCVDAWRVPLGMHVETRDVSVRWK